MTTQRDAHVVAWTRSRRETFWEWIVRWLELRYDPRRDANSYVSREHMYDLNSQVSRNRWYDKRGNRWPLRDAL